MPIVTGSRKITMTDHYRYSQVELLKMLGFRDDQIEHLAGIEISLPLVEDEPGGRAWELVITFTEEETTPS